MKLFFRKSGAGRPLVILHGLFGMSDNWMSLSRMFAENGFLVYAVDLRNHGRSPRDDEFNYGVMSADIAELIDDEKLGAVNIIGHSMGAKAAMWLACENPALVSKLIAADMSPRYYAPHHQSVFAAIHAVQGEYLESRKSAESRLRETLHDDSTVQFLLKNLYWNEAEKLDWRFDLSSIEKNIDAVGVALPEGFHFNGPALFIKGERSGYITADDVPLIKKHFPQSKIVSVPDAGHWVHAENPLGFMQEVMDFLS